MQFGACYGRTVIFLPGPSDVFRGGNEEHKRRFYSNPYDSFLRSGYWQQFEEMASAGQSSSIASDASNNTNASRPSENCSFN